MIRTRQIISILLALCIAAVSAGCSVSEKKRYYYAERLKYELADDTPELTCFDLYNGELYGVALDLSANSTDAVRLGIYSKDGGKKGDISIGGINGVVSCFDIFDDVIYLVSTITTNHGNVCSLYSVGVNGGEAEKICDFDGVSDVKKICASNDGNIYFLAEKPNYERYSDVIYLDNNEAIDYQYSGEVFASCGRDGGNYIESDIPYPMAFDERDGTVIVYAFEQENGFYFRNYKTEETGYTNKLGNVTDMELINDNNDIAFSALSDYIGTLAVSGITDESGIVQLDDSLYFSVCGSICAEGDELCVNALNDPYDPYRSVFRYNTASVNTADPPVNLIFSSFYKPLFSCGSQIKNERLSSEEFALSVLSLDPGYDLMMMNTREYYAYNVKEKGSFYPLNDIPGVSEYIEKCFPSVRETAVDENGDIWMLPLSLDVSTVIYNKKNCADSGIAFTSDVSDFVSQIRKASEVSEYYECSEYLVTESMFNSYLSVNDGFDTEIFRNFAPLLKEILTDKAFQYNPNVNVGLALSSKPINDKMGYSDEQTDDTYQNALFTAIFSSDSQRTIIDDENLLAASMPYVTGTKPCSVCSFICVNPNSAHLEETLAYVERLTSYLTLKNESFVFDDKDSFGNTPLAKSLYEIYANTSIYFDIPATVYYNDFNKYRAGEITLEEFIAEADCRLSAYLNE